ncbi:histidine phosphatase family protein [Gammaproteobacteria bacterium]|nr:histidine phosphatase family protein [Gammaproteobacteria bacterium]
MSQSHIILVRHGEASAGWSVHPDPGLSVQGREQAENSGKNLINELSYYQLVSSPKKRAIETMEIMNQGDTNFFKLDPRFIEIPSGNINANKKKEWLVNIFTTPIEELPEAVKKWRNELINWLKEVEGNFIVTTHFMVINALVSHITSNHAISYFHPDYASRTEIFIRNGELTQLILGDDKKNCN